MGFNMAHFAYHRYKFTCFTKTLRFFALKWITPGRIRTCDLRIRNPLLYPAELRAQKKPLSLFLYSFPWLSVKHLERIFEAKQRCRRLQDQGLRRTTTVLVLSRGARRFAAARFTGLSAGVKPAKAAYSVYRPGGAAAKKPSSNGTAG